MIVNNKIESSKQSEIEIAALQLLIHLQVNFLLPWKACGVSSGPADSANEMQIWRETKDDSIVAAETAWRWPELKTILQVFCESLSLIVCPKALTVN